MQNVRRIKTDVKPDVFQNLGNNTYYYNYDPQSEIIKVPNMETNELEEKTFWTFVQVHLSGIPNYKNCVNAIIREHISINEEFALINKYNGFKLGLNSDPEIESKYINYLDTVNSLKEIVKKDFDLE